MRKKTTVNELIKNEICNLEYTKKQAYWILCSMFLNNIQIKLNNQQLTYSYQSSFIPLIRFIKKMSLLLNLETINQINIVDNNLLNNQDIIEINFSEDINSFFKLDHFNKNFLVDLETKRLFLLGAYLSTGSISYSTNKSSYHFEIKSYKLEYIELIQSILNDFSIVSKFISYRNHYVIYIKKAQYISDLLKLFNALESMYTFEDYRIKRDFINANQRLNNLDISNLNKTVKASSDQIKWINLIKSKQLLKMLTPKVQQFCEIRLKYPELSLNDLVDVYKNQYHIDISRSTINYYVNEVKKLYMRVNDK